MSNQKPFDLNLHTARLLMREPFFAALSRKIDKTPSTSIPTAGVRVNPERAQFELYYNPEFFGALKDEHKLGVLMHEFYHIIFEHVTGRLPEGGLSQLDNVCMDAAINGLPEMKGKLPCEADPGPILSGSTEPMKGVMPGEGIFKDAPAGMTYEWYKEWLKKNAPEPQEGEGGEGEGSPYGDSFDDHGGFGEGDATTQEIAKERLKKALKEASEEATKARDWGSVSEGVRKEIQERIQTRVDWRKVIVGPPLDALTSVFPVSILVSASDATPRSRSALTRVDQSLIRCLLPSIPSWTSWLRSLSSPWCPSTLSWRKTRYILGKRASVRPGSVS